jgi:hypothetical protein
VSGRLGLPSFMKQRISLWADWQRSCLLEQPLCLVGQAFTNAGRLLATAMLYPRDSMSIEGQTDPKDERD